MGKLMGFPMLKPDGTITFKKLYDISKTYIFAQVYVFTF